MRPSAAVPLLFTLVAFILTLLCIFAGNKPGYLENANMVTVNTSMLGQATFNTSKSSSKILNSIQSTIKSDLNKAVSDIAKELNIKDFYSAHILDYCEGYYTPGPVQNLTTTVSENVTHCSNQTGMFHFDPASVIQSELKPGINLTDLKWPSAIQDGIRAIEVASKVMFVVYCTGASAVGVALLGAILGIFVSGRLSAVVNVMVATLAFFSLLIASAIATGIINNVSNTINQHGNDIGVYAYRGTTFIGMTWAATILVVLAGCVWAYEFIRGKRERMTYIMEGKEGEL